MIFGKRILILIPHPDDEVVACAASLKRAQDQGAEIFGLYLTQGCVDRDTLWRWQRGKYDRRVATRRGEAQRAAEFLGIQQVGWSPRPARFLWREMKAVRSEVEVALDHCRPDQLWVPAFEGGNPDHDALNAIASTFKARLSVLEFAEYNYFGGKAQSQSFIATDETTRVMELSPEEAIAKRAALDIYVSEKGNLSEIRCAQESCRPLPVYHYSQPPHQGKLWYNRFQWVPFRHPRVDTTEPAEVSAAIMNFLAQA